MIAAVQKVFTGKTSLEKIPVVNDADVIRTVYFRNVYLHEIVKKTKELENLHKPELFFEMKNYGTVTHDIHTIDLTNEDDFVGVYKECIYVPLNLRGTPNLVERYANLPDDVIASVLADKSDDAKFVNGMNVLLDSQRPLWGKLLSPTLVFDAQGVLVDPGAGGSGGGGKTGAPIELHGFSQEDYDLIPIKARKMLDKEYDAMSASGLSEREKAAHRKRYEDYRGNFRRALSDLKPKSKVVEVDELTEMVRNFMIKQ